VRTLLALTSFVLGTLPIVAVARIDAQPSTRRDSAGIVITMSTSSAVRSLPGWRVSTEPDLQIGAVEGDPRLEFSGINGIGALPDGAIVLVDGGSREVRLFDNRGTFIASVGRSGQGPGEFRRAALVPAIRYDSLRVLDGQAGRLTTFDLSGRLGATRVIPEARSMIPIGSLANSRLVLEPNRPLFLRRAAEVLRFEHSYLLIPPAGSPIDTLETFALYRLLARYPNSTVLLQDSPPFSALPSAAVGTDAIFITSGSEPEIRKYDGNGILRAIFRVSGISQVLSSGEFRDSLERSLDKVEPADRRMILAQTPVPTRRPLWMGLVVDAEGYVWARAHQKDTATPARWLIFSPDGTALGTLETPAGLEVDYIGRDFILGRWRNADRVQFVRRYVLRRAGR